MITSFRPPAARETALIELFAAAGYAPVEPPILQPAEVFLDLSGEDLRRRMFLTSDAEGAELCLRPDLTIPTAMLHLAAGAPLPAAYGYLGPVFRQRPQGPSEFLQAGVESFGRTDQLEVDAAVMGLAQRALEALGGVGSEIKVGDVGLLGTVLDALEVPPVWRRRLRRDLPRAALEARGAGAPARHAALVAALDGSGPSGARAAVEDLLTIAGIATVGGRSPAEIAERFLSQARLAAGDHLSEAARGALDRFLAVETTLDRAPEALAAFARGSGLALDAAIGRFARRVALLAAEGLDPGRVGYAAGFGRKLDYYTGFVFEFRAPGRDADGPLIGGGRYDGLLKMLGAAEAVPAVGFSIWLDRVAEARP